MLSDVCYLNFSNYEHIKKLYVKVFSIFLTIYLNTFWSAKPSKDRNAENEVARAKNQTIRRAGCRFPKVVDWIYPL